MDEMPTGDVSRRTFGAGDNADGMREREASIWLRMEAAEGMGYSPYVRLAHPSRQIRNA